MTSPTRHWRLLENSRQVAIHYRNARKEDCLRIAALDAIASGGAIDYLFHGLVPDTSPVEIVAKTLESDAYPHSFKNVIIAETGRSIIGMALSFPASCHGVTDEMRAFFPGERLERFKHFFAARVEGSYFLDALGVDENHRCKGVGGTLIAHTKEKAKREGYDVLSLIVFKDNAEAVRLYRRAGFDLVRRIPLKPHPLLPHDGGCLLMKAST